ncbi:hypothetical protein ACTWM0_13310 [Pseudomonas machongensis]
MYQPASKALYVENLGLHFPTRLAQTNLENPTELIASATLTAGAIKPLIRAGKIEADRALLKLADNARIATSALTLSQIEHGLSSRSPLQLERFMPALLRLEMVPARVIPKEQASADQAERMLDVTGIKLSAEESRRRAQSQCTGNVFSNFETASREVAKIAELKLNGNWAAVPNALARSARLPVNATDPHFASLKRFESAYRDLSFIASPSIS